MNEINIPVSIGELIDKITILEIKWSLVRDPIKVMNIESELIALQQILEKINLDEHCKMLQQELYATNLSLWTVEDFLRECEADQTFDNEFIRQSRNVYKLNDHRAKLKREINVYMKSPIIEEKSYASYAIGE